MSSAGVCKGGGVCANARRLQPMLSHTTTTTISITTWRMGAKPTMLQLEAACSPCMHWRPQLLGPGRLACPPAAHSSPAELFKLRHKALNPNSFLQQHGVRWDSTHQLQQAHLSRTGVSVTWH